MESIDIFVQNYFYATRTSSLTHFFYIITTLFDLSFPFILILGCFTYLIYLVRNLRYAIFFLLTIVSTTGVVYLMKIFFNTSRPTDAVIHAFGQSFPSYHATISTVFFFLLIYIFDDYLKGSSKKIFNFLCIVPIFLVSTSRLYLGVHWFSDVFSGFILGCFIVYVAVLFFKRVMIVQYRTSMLK